MGGECTQVTQIQPAKGRAAAQAWSLAGLPGEHPSPGAGLSLQPLVLSFVRTYNDSDLWQFKSLLLKNMVL